MATVALQLADHGQQTSVEDDAHLTALTSLAASGIDFAGTWAKLWGIYGCGLVNDRHGRFMLARALPTDDVFPVRGEVEPILALRNQDEWIGATKALETMLRMLGAEGRNLVSAFATEAGSAAK